MLEIDGEFWKFCKNFGKMFLYILFYMLVSINEEYVFIGEVRVEDSEIFFLYVFSGCL